MGFVFCGSPSEILMQATAQLLSKMYMCAFKSACHFKHFPGLSPDCSLSSSSVHGILQARILERAAIPFSRGSSQPRARTEVSCIAGGCFTMWATREARRPLQKPSISSWASQAVLVVKNLPLNAGDVKRRRFHPWLGKIPWRRAWQPTPVFLPGESCGQRSLAGYSPRGRTSWTQLSDWARTHTHTHPPPYKEENRTSLKLVLLKGLNKIMCAVLAWGDNH